MKIKKFNEARSFNKEIRPIGDFLYDKFFMDYIFGRGGEIKERLIPWYENYFLGYGYQEIKNIALASNNKRLVFYFTKLRFEK